MINGFQESCTWIIYNNKQLTLLELLDEDKSIPIHGQDIFDRRHFFECFNLRNKLNYNLHHASYFDVPQASSSYNETESISFLGTQN